MQGRRSASSSTSSSRRNDERADAPQAPLNAARYAAQRILSQSGVPDLIASMNEPVSTLITLSVLLMTAGLVIALLSSVLGGVLRATVIAIAHLALGLLGMDGFLWLVMSWAFVGGLCYLALHRLGNSGGEQSSSSSSQGSSKTKTSDSKQEWPNDIGNWLYHNMHKVPEPLDAWIRSLNEAAKKVTTPTKCEILFEGFGDHSKVSEPPKLSNIRVENGPRDHLTVRSNIHLPCTQLKLVSSQRTPERMIVSNFNAKIIDLRGEVEARLACIANQLYVMGCFNGRPEMEVELTNTDPNYQTEVNRALVEEGVRRCLLSAVTNVNLSEGAERSSIPRISPHFGNMRDSSPFLSHQPSYEAPQQQQHSTMSSTLPNNISQPAQDIFKKINDTKLLTSPTQSVVPNKLRVNVIRAQKLGGVSGADEPYVVIEMDEPPQKYATSKSINANPFWEEQFDFELTPASEEILFEVYDGVENRHPGEEEKRFLGLAIVNFEEIRRSGEQVHILTLQGRPYRSDPVAGGMLTARFDFYCDPTFSIPGKIVDQITIKNKDGSEFRETVSTQRRALYDPHDDYEPVEIIPTKTTTFSVKTVGKSASSDKPPPGPPSEHSTLERREKQTQQQSHSMYQQQPTSTTIISDLKNEVKYGTLERNKDKTKPPLAKQPAYEPEAAHLHVQETFTVEDSRQSRGREKQQNGGPKRERSFFSELRKRLSGNRKSQVARARSVDVANDDLEEAVSLPPSRDHSQTRYAADGKNRRYFETTSVGGKSGESTKSLYQHSTLVLELNEDNQRKYFLIPPNMQTDPSAVRLLKRGKKLHIYNEHTFVAVKIKGGALCNVCNGRIGRSFSKQAYQCRDCKMVSHKSCHYKTDTFCTESTVSKLHIGTDTELQNYIVHKVPMQHVTEYISYEGV